VVARWILSENTPQRCVDIIVVKGIYVYTNVIINNVLRVKMYND